MTCYVFNTIYLTLVYHHFMDLPHILRHMLPIYRYFVCRIHRHRPVVRDPGPCALYDAHELSDPTHHQTTRDSLQCDFHCTPLISAIHRDYLNNASFRKTLSNLQTKWKTIMWPTIQTAANIWERNEPLGKELYWHQSPGCLHTTLVQPHQAPCDNHRIE